MIPKIIWQTYKDPFDKLPSFAKNAIQTWKDMNPEYDYRYMDDNEAASFVLNEYGEEWHNLFVKAPVGVMRGDIWRYLIINTFGGVYADIDTVCIEPIKVWMKDSYDLVLCIDDDLLTFSQYAFAGSKNTKAMSFVIKDLFEQLKTTTYDSRGFVHTVTGSAMWTEAIKKATNTTSIIPYRQEMRDELLDILEKNHNIYCYSDWKYFHEGIVIKHLVGHNNWSEEGYVQWTKEVDNFLGDKK